MKAFKAPGRSDRLLVEVEEFIELVLARKPDRVGLRPALGILDFHGKEDWVAAANDLTLFLEEADETESASIRQYADKLRTEALRRPPASDDEATA